MENGNDAFLQFISHLIINNYLPSTEQMLQAQRLIRHGFRLDNYINQGSIGCCNKETNFIREIVQMQKYVFCFYNGLWVDAPGEGAALVSRGP